MIENMQDQSWEILVWVNVHLVHLIMVENFLYFENYLYFRSTYNGYFLLKIYVIYIFELSSTIKKHRMFSNLVIEQHTSLVSIDYNKTCYV